MTQLMEQNQALQKQLDEKSKEPEPPKKKEPEPDPEPPKMSEDDKKISDKFDEDWPEHAKAMDVKVNTLLATIEHRITAAINEKLKGIEDQFNEKLEPIVKTTATVANNTFRQEVMKSHKDLDAIMPGLETWIGSQPQAIRKGYEETMATAPAPDVVKLIDLYKKTNGIAAPPSKKKETTPPADPAKNKRMDSMESVDESSSSPVGGEADKNDFDGAFDEAIG